MSGFFSALDISGSGMSAERLRMEITANNIANAGTTRTENGDPYRRQAVVFSSVLSKESGLADTERLQGVKAVGIEPDSTEFPVVYNPGHPHADAQGMVRLSNVKIPHEMVDLITSSRSYEANAKAVSLFKEMVEQTLNLLQGAR